MSETQDPTQQPTGPRVDKQQMRDLGRLRRSASDSYVAGVAGGLGRHFDVDPTVVRVLLAVLTLFGGAGLVIYAAVWLLVPEDGHDRAAIDLGGDLTKALLIGAAIVAALIVFGSPFVDMGWGFPVPFLLVCLLALWVYTLVRRDRRTRPRPDATPPAPWGAAAYATPEGAPMTADTDTQALPTDPPSWTPPAYSHTYTPPPPRPRRRGPVLFWPTLALIAIGLGTLGMVDVSASITPSAYAALALTITAVMLLVGAFVARPGGLIALGILFSLGLGASSAVGAATGWQSGGGSLSYAPVSAAEVRDGYDVANGDIDLDLRGVGDLAQLDGRTVAVRLYAGEIDVQVPAGLNVVVDADLAYAGTISIDGAESGGIDLHRNAEIAALTSTDAPTLTLDLDARVGDIVVTQS